MATVTGSEATCTVLGAFYLEQQPMAGRLTHLRKRPSDQVKGPHQRSGAELLGLREVAALQVALGLLLQKLPLGLAGKGATRGDDKQQPRQRARVTTNG